MASISQRCGPKDREETARPWADHRYPWPKRMRVCGVMFSFHLHPSHYPYYNFQSQKPVFYHLQSAIMYLALIVRFKWRISLVTKNPSWPNTPIMKKMLLSMISSSTMLLLIFSSNSLLYSVHTDDWMFKYHSEKCGHVIDCIYGGSIYKQENISERISTCVLMHDRIILENMFLSIFPSSTTLTFNGKHNI